MVVLHQEGRLTPAQAAFMAKTRPDEELYDLEKDPHEMNNVASDPRYRQHLERMRSILEKWIVETNDHGMFREDPEIAENVRRNFWKTIYEPGMKKRGLDPNVTSQEYLAYWQERMLSRK